MTATVKKTKLQTWGNSQGIRIPRATLREIGINETDNVELDVIVRNGEICISPSLTPYERLMKEAGNPKMSEASRNFSWDRNEEEERLLNEQAGTYQD